MDSKRSESHKTKRGQDKHIRLGLGLYMRGTKHEKSANNTEASLQDHIIASSRKVADAQQTYNQSAEKRRKYRLPNSYADMIEKNSLEKGKLEENLEQIEKKVNKVKNQVHRNYFGATEHETTEVERVEQFNRQYQDQKKSDKVQFKKELEQKLKDHKIIVQTSKDDKKKAFTDILKNILVQKLKSGSDVESQKNADDLAKDQRHYS